ncbi:zf-CCHC domain-containing protein [Tanacetum coccineum]
MKRPSLFKSDSFIYWKNRFERFVKSKDLDLWHVIKEGDFLPIQNNLETKLDEVVPFEKQNDDLIKRLAKNNEAKMVIYSALPRKEYERIFMCNTGKEILKTLSITHQDSAFARFNTIITSLKALDESYSSKNYVRKFLRVLHPKWRAKVTAIEESKDLTSLSLDEVIVNIKVHEMIIKKDTEIVKARGERISLALKAKKDSSDEQSLNFRSKDEEYAMEVRDLKKFFKRSGRECPKPPRDKNQKASVGYSWSDSGEEDDEKAKDETCLMDHAYSESTRSLNEMISLQKPFRDKSGLVFNSFEESTSETKKTEFMKSQNEMSSSGDPVIADDGPLSVQTAPKENQEPLVCSSENRKSVSFQKSILGPRAKHIMVNNVKIPVASDDEICLGINLEPNRWIKDNGCSKHMMGYRKLFSSYKAYNGCNVVFGSNLCGIIIGKGQICDNKCKLVFLDHDSEISKDGKVIGRGIKKSDLYVMKLGKKSKDKICIKMIIENSTLWHRRLGLANMRLIQTLASKELVRNLPKLRTDHSSEFDNEVQFGEFCNANSITHNVSAPRTPQSNGVVEMS